MLSNSMMQQSFTPFKRLPFEIRCKIWRFTLHEYRFVTELNVSYNKVCPLYPPPAVLHANRESREEAMTALMSLSFDLPDHATHTKVYIHPRNKIMYLREGRDYPSDYPSTVDFEDSVTRVLYHFATSLSDDERAKVQHIAIDTFEWARVDMPEEFSQQISRFLGLQTLVVVLEGRGKTLGDKVLVHCTHSTRKEEYHVKELFESILSNTTQLLPYWKSPELEVVYWEGAESQCSGGCGCDPKNELRIL